MLHFALSSGFIKARALTDSGPLVQGPVLLPEDGDFVGDCYPAPLATTLEATKLERFGLFPFLSLETYVFITRIKLEYIITEERMNSIDFKDICASLRLKEDII